LKSKPKIGVIDTGTSNIRSVIYALLEKNADVKQISNFEDYTKNIDALVVPGIGSFGFVMDKLKKERLDKVILEELSKGKPSMFICVGMQILFSSSNEFKKCKGLNYFEGEVKKIKENGGDGKKKRTVPMIGWNKLNKKNSCKVLNVDKLKNFFYFTHSYYADPKDKSIISSTSNYKDFEYCSSLSKDNVCAFQFHPEKSGKEGLKIYKNFLNLI
tara:strand:+ start:1475 stop:2119 length:645 start_codon:yes stop_codon:yes gene_type:complete